VSDVLDLAAFCEHVARELDLAVAHLAADARLVEDLCFDSVLMFELLLVVEDLAGVTLPDALVGQLVTVRDAFAVYAARAADGGSTARR
jgi:acyl carrier protein